MPLTLTVLGCLWSLPAEALRTHTPHASAASFFLMTLRCPVGKPPTFLPLDRSCQHHLPVPNHLHLSRPVSSALLLLSLSSVITFSNSKAHVSDPRTPQSPVLDLRATPQTHALLSSLLAGPYFIHSITGKCNHPSKIQLQTLQLPHPPLTSPLTPSRAPDPTILQPTGSTVLISFPSSLIPTWPLFLLPHCHNKFLEFFSDNILNSLDRSSMAYFQVATALR